MLASITPLGERGRQSRWWLTVSAFLLGAAAAGLAVGAIMGLAGSVFISGPSPGIRLVVLIGAAVAALALDLGPARVPGPRRQVDDRWRDRYRGWVYGLGYGAQLGVGVTTIVSSAATYVALLAALLSGSARSGALIFGLFGALRGALPLLVAHVQGPDQLFAAHQRLERWRSPARRLGSLLLSAGVALAVAGLLA